jgi:8-oxo-dGTP pyrophosphatase MutT (NUDIX family)
VSSTADVRVIEAAGGVLWRPADNAAGLEIAVVHRPKYDDWSLPKGKIKSDEHPIVGALREVAEETGFTGVVGRDLGEIHYLKDGAPKRVRYWSMRCDDGRFRPNDEVDELAWLSPDSARKRLLPERDRDLVSGLGRRRLDTTAVVLLRHASAGERSSDADDHARPLDARGTRQSDALIELLDAFDVRRVFSADRVRCVQTVEPYAQEIDVRIGVEPAFSEEGLADSPDAAGARIVALAHDRVPLVVSCQRRSIVALANAVTDAFDGPHLDDERPVRKGSGVVVHLSALGGRTVVAVDRLDAVSG